MLNCTLQQSERLDPGVLYKRPPHPSADRSWAARASTRSDTRTFFPEHSAKQLSKHFRRLGKGKFVKCLHYFKYIFCFHAVFLSSRSGNQAAKRQPNIVRGQEPEPNGLALSSGTNLVALHSRTEERPTVRASGFDAILNNWLRANSRRLRHTADVDIIDDGQTTFRTTPIRKLVKR